MARNGGQLWALLPAGPHHWPSGLAKCDLSELPEWPEMVASSELCSQQDPITGLQVWTRVMLGELPWVATLGEKLWAVLHTGSHHWTPGLATCDIVELSEWPERVRSSQLCSQQDPITGLQVWSPVILVWASWVARMGENLLALLPAGPSHWHPGLVTCYLSWASWEWPHRVRSSELCSQQAPITGLQVWSRVILGELPESGL